MKVDLFSGFLLGSILLTSSRCMAAPRGVRKGGSPSSNSDESSSSWGSFHEHDSMFKPSPYLHRQVMNSPVFGYTNRKGKAITQKAEPKTLLFGSTGNQKNQKASKHGTSDDGIVHEVESSVGPSDSAPAPAPAATNNPTTEPSQENEDTPSDLSPSPSFATSPLLEPSKKNANVPTDVSPSVEPLKENNDAPSDSSPVPAIALMEPSISPPTTNPQHESPPPDVLTSRDDALCLPDSEEKKENMKPAATGMSPPQETASPLSATHKGKKDGSSVSAAKSPSPSDIVVPDTIRFPAPSPLHPVQSPKAIAPIGSRPAETESDDDSNDDSGPVVVVILVPVSAPETQPQSQHQVPAPANVPAVPLPATKAPLPGIAAASAAKAALPNSEGGFKRREKNVSAGSRGLKGFRAPARSVMTTPAQPPSSLPKKQHWLKNGDGGYYGDEGPSIEESKEQSSEEEEGDGGYYGDEGPSIEESKEQSSEEEEEEQEGYSQQSHEDQTSTNGHGYLWHLLGHLNPFSHFKRSRDNNDDDESDERPPHKKRRR